MKTWAWEEDNNCITNRLNSLFCGLKLGKKVKIKIVDLLFCHDWRAAVFSLYCLCLKRVSAKPIQSINWNEAWAETRTFQNNKIRKSEKNQKCLHVELRLRVNRKHFLSSQISKSTKFWKTIFLKKAFSTTKTGCGFFIVANSNSLLHDLQVTLKGTWTNQL